MRSLIADLKPMIHFLFSNLSVLCKFILCGMRQVVMWLSLNANILIMSFSMFSNRFVQCKWKIIFFFFSHLSFA